MILPCFNLYLDDFVADATGVDDSTWHYGIARGDPVKGGAVLVHVLPGGGTT